ncbi:glycoside hydrolase family 16 protein [Pseudonocardia nematodicida]|uniref:Glycoside hydrolase family 16 protein n=1 Tax=Pseudonocardia nematodicida TaxID=1206997 RepID=A0ABV1K9I2_9PSEU
MRRKSSAAVDRLDTREPVERVAAEHSSPSVPSSRAGRDASAAVPAAVLLQEEGVSASGRHRAWSAEDDFAGGDSFDAGPVTGTGRHAAVETSGGALADLHDTDSSLVAVDRSAPAGRSRLRRFAPLGVGVAAVLAAAMVFTLLQPGAEDPSLDAALVDDSSRRSSSENTLATNPAIGNGGANALGDAAEGAAGQIGPALAAAEAARERAERGSGSGDAPSGDAPAPRSTGGGGGAPQNPGDGIQAALQRGWQAAGGDEFPGSSLGGNWSAYDSEGHDGQGRRTPDAVSVENGNLVIRGDSQGNTGGVSWGTPQMYGKWEMRAQFPAGDVQYHPVLILWPSEIPWPRGGEVDFAETTSASDDVSFFLHYGDDNRQVQSTRRIDITQWNNYAVEWTPNAIIGYINGEEWFRSEDPATLPPGPMHATIQLDYFPNGSPVQPSEMRVAWMRQYS